jgi:hypothetical protein
VLGGCSKILAALGGTGAGLRGGKGGVVGVEGCYVAAPRPLLLWEARGLGSGEERAE